MVAATRAGVFAIRHEFFGAHPGFKCCVVQKFGVINQFAPRAHRLDVHLHHARIGGDLQHLEPWVARRWIALKHHLQLQSDSGALYGADQL